MPEEDCQKCTHKDVCYMVRVATDVAPWIMADFCKYFKEG